MKKVNGGFIGLLALLISMAIIAFIILRTDLLKGTSITTNENGEAVEVDNTNMIQGGFDSINKARDAKNLIEQNNRKAGGY